MGWLSKKSAPAPPPPDYTKAAELTAASNQEAQTRADYANRGNITDAWGTQTSTARLVTDPATGKQYTTYDTSYTLNPQQQAALDAQMRIDASKSQMAESMLGRAGAAVANPMDYSGFQSWGAAPTVGNLDPNAYMTGGAGEGIMRGFSADPYKTTGAGQGMMNTLDMASLGGMPQADAQERQRIENMLFSRMQPQHQQAQAQLETQLLNQGYQRGSPQYQQALQDLQRNQADERFNAMQTGGQEMERLFGMGMQARGQSWQELLGSGQFQNQAQAQAQAQRLAENAQNYGQGLSSAQFGNQAQEQAYQQALAQNQQNFGIQQAGQAQTYNQQMQNAAYQNQLRGAQIAEEMQKRQMPLNELNAFLSGSQVEQPNMQAYTPSQSAGGVDYSGAALNTYNAQKDAAAAAAAKKQGLMSGLGGLASAGIMAF